MVDCGAPNPIPVMHGQHGYLMRAWPDADVADVAARTLSL
jgi:hypothetical protein